MGKTCCPSPGPVLGFPNVEPWGSLTTRGRQAAAPGTSPQQVPYLGLRRLTSVRITLTAAGPVCEVTGIGHRAPISRRISLGTATTLSAAGVPTVVRHSSTAASAGSARP